MRRRVVLGVTGGVLGVAVLGTSIGAAATGDHEAAVIETIEMPELDGWTMSPDGALVVGFMGAYPDPDSWCLHELATGVERWCIDAAPGGEPLVSAPAWLPDGSAVLLTESPSRESDIWRIDAASGAATDLTDDGYTGAVGAIRASLRPGDPPVLADLHPRVALDGSRVMFMRVAASGPDETTISLQVMPIGGGAPTQAVALDRALGTDPAWGWDGRWLHWVEAGDQGDLTIGSATADGRETRRVPVASAEDGAVLPDELLGALADGRLLAVGACHGFGVCSSWLVDPETGVADRLVPSVPDDPSLRLLQVAASPDGRHVAALVVRDDTTGLELIDIGTRAARSIPLPDLQPTRDSRVRWLIDGRIIVGGDRRHPRQRLVITLPPD